MENKGKAAEELLQNIFEITEGLYGEMRNYQANGEDNHEKIYRLLTELGRTLVNADRASFWRWDKHAGVLVTTAAVGEGQIEIPEGTGLVGKALMEKRPIVTNDPYHCPDFNAEVDKKTGYVTDSILVMPIVDCKGEYIGVYQAINKLPDEDGKKRGFSLEEDCHRLSLAAFICGLTLESDLFLDESQRDKLTSIKNRMGFYRDYDKIFLPKMRDPVENGPVSLLICDIDFFKKVNDTYGHNAGDAVLTHVAKMLRSSIRDSDGVYRWGGEEFIIMFSNADLTQAVTIAERIRKKIEASVCTFEGTDIKVTMSFGCAAADVTKSAEDNIKIADERLYKAKESGRNRVVAE